ncbi:MAG: glycosyltransferase family 2 protein [Oscillospiraceae bacterium]|nr:glycosyltransferase family 2 protein [Oscillospiraceae bacterium]
MKLSLVVPCYNEEKNVSLFYEAAKSDFSGAGFDYEIVFVNDGSHDGTFKELQKLMDGDIPVKIVNFSRNFGKESAMYAGLRESEGDYVTIIDADLQQRPAIALDMVRMLDSEPEYDCIAAFQDKRKEGKVLSFFKNSFYKLINKFADTEFVQGASDFRTFRRPMVEAILSMDEYFRFSKGLFSWVGFNTKFIPYEVQERATGTSKWSFRKLFKYALDGIFAFTTAPLRIATILGLVTSFFSILYLIIVVIQKLAFGIAVAGYATIVVLILLLGGIQLCCIGIIGEYIARTYIQTKGRPIYIAKDVLKNGKYDK